VITHLLDADWLIDAINGVESAYSVVERLVDRGEVATSVVVLGEVREGLLASGISPKRQQRFEALADAMEVIPIERGLVPWFADLRYRLRSTGRIIGDHDIWIAATALEYDLTLISRDRHFDRIPNLKLYS